MPVDHKGSRIFIVLCAAASTLSILMIMGAILITVLANKDTIEHNKGVIETNRDALGGMNHGECNN